MTTQFTIEYDSADLARLQRALDKLDSQHLAYPMFKQIGKDIAGKAGAYPAWSDSPPYPYYIRGRGTQFSPNYNDMKSERLNTRWFWYAFPDHLLIENLASYAYLVHGEQQTDTHKRHGWKQLLQTAKDELPGVIKKLEARALKLWNETL